MNEWKMDANSKSSLCLILINFDIMNIEVHMKKVAVLLADGFEEIEALTVVDVLRRANIHCDMVSIASLNVTGSHKIEVVADRIITENMNEYDMVVLPGGLPGATNLRDNQDVIALIKQFNNDSSKYIAAICAAPIVLEKAGIIERRSITSYPSPSYIELFAKAN
jgi:4-methyl-5(b-hydroxyethyl)-thiazole monophosphate biosynthesis